MSIGRHHNGITEKPRKDKKKTENPEEVSQNRLKTLGKTNKNIKNKKSSNYEGPCVGAGRGKGA